MVADFQRCFTAFHSVLADLGGFVGDFGGISGLFPRSISTHFERFGRVFR